MQQAHISDAKIGIAHLKPHKAKLTGKMHLQSKLYF